MGYDRSTLFETNEVEDVVDLLMALINGIFFTLISRLHGFL